ncbi:MAG: hypothetical protein LBM73_03755 [Candidatus Nomurabacteria bacterium]|jgi:CHASE3 domain sensor protein|nr:hypothetical protein [Candidatus Nomurabacteria bacterium]
MDAFQILVIILALVLLLFLILAIVVLVQLIKISARIRQITDAVGDTVNGVKKTLEQIRRALTPAIVGKNVMNFVQKIWKPKRKEHNGEEK